MKNKLSQNITYWLGVAAIGLVVGLSLQFVRAWTEPAVAPPGGNVGAPINTSINPQTKAGGLGVTQNLIVGGSVGIGTASPAQKLDVVGNVRANDVCTTGGKCLSAAASSLNQSNCYWTAHSPDSLVCNSGYYMAGYQGGAAVNNSWYNRIYCCKS